MKFIKENPVLSMGIFLPIILMAVFFVSAHLPKSTENAPKYDFIFQHKQYQHNQSDDYRVSYTVKNGKISASAILLDEKEKKRSSRYIEKIFRYDVKKEQSIEIVPVVTKISDTEYSVTLPSISNVSLSTSLESPDGYTFRNQRYNNSGLFGEIFGFRKRNHGYIITKGRAHYKINMPEGNGYYSWYRSEGFLGWIVEE